MFNQSLDIVSNPAHTSIAAVLLLAVWFLVYLLVCKWCPLLGLVKFKVDDTRNRIVSMIHGAISFCFACTQFLPFATFDLPNTFAQTSICLFSLSYCLYDLAACIYYKLDDLSLWLHHFFCINGFGFAVATGYGAIDGIGGLFVAEVSNLPMHLRMILRNYGLKYTRTYELVENIYLALYVCFRGLYCPFFLLYPCLMSSHTPILVKAMCFSLTVQSYYFIVQMWKIIQKKFQRSNEMKAIGVQLQWLSQDEQQLSKLSFYRKNDDKKIF